MKINDKKYSPNFGLRKLTSFNDLAKKSIPMESNDLKEFKNYMKKVRKQAIKFAIQAKKSILIYKKI